MMLKTNTSGALTAAAGALVAVGLVILIVLVVEPRPTEATFPDKNGNIAYTSLDGTAFEIYTIPTTGGTPTRLTNNRADDSRPAYSPDGTKIAFISDRDGNEEIYVMDAADRDVDGNGDNLTRLTNNAAADQDPAYSPDGTKIAFETLRDGNEEIYVMDAADRDVDGNGDNLTRLTSNATGDSDPSFSPDGTKIAFETLRDGNKEIYMMDAADRDVDGNGDNPTRLTNIAADDANPSFSPDGTKIAFETLRDGNREIYMMDAADRDVDGNGDNPIRLTSNAATDQNPSCSPDSTKIAFETLRDGNREIYMMDAADRDVDGNGDNPIQLTNNASPDRYPDWGSHADVSPPSGFTDSPVVSGLTDPMDMEFAPDGRLFVAEQAGRVRIANPDGPLVTFLDISTRVESSNPGGRGLQALTFDPGFTSNRYVYLHYTRSATSTTPVHNRIVRVTANANGTKMVSGSEKLIFRLGNQSTHQHHGGAIDFGKDGKLYVATGDNDTPDKAQQLTNFFGKMLRINKSGTIPTTNPFYATTSGKNRAIWALGLRNPFKFAVQPGMGTFYINDPGEDAWEEINRGAAGANYGWPIHEGVAKDPPYVDPIFAYGPEASPTGCAMAITGGTFYNPTPLQFPSQFEGDYFFADYCHDWIKKLDSSTREVSVFATEIDKPIDLEVSEEGELYYLSRGSTGLVSKIRYTG